MIDIYHLSRTLANQYQLQLFANYIKETERMVKILESFISWGLWNGNFTYPDNPIQWYCRWCWSFKNNKIYGEGNFILKAKRGFGQGFPNWLKLSNMVQQSPSNSKQIGGQSKLIRSWKVGACADAHLPLPLTVRFRSWSHQTDKLLLPIVIYEMIHIRFCAKPNLLPLAAFA